MTEAVCSVGLTISDSNKHSEICGLRVTVAESFSEVSYAHDNYTVSNSNKIVVQSADGGDRVYQYFSDHNNGDDDEEDLDWQNSSDNHESSEDQLRSLSPSDSPEPDAYYNVESTSTNQGTGTYTNDDDDVITSDDSTEFSDQKLFSVAEIVVSDANSHHTPRVVVKNEVAPLRVRRLGSIFTIEADTAAESSYNERSTNSRNPAYSNEADMSEEADCSDDGDENRSVVGHSDQIDDDQLRNSGIATSNICSLCASCNEVLSMEDVAKFESSTFRSLCDESVRCCAACLRAYELWHQSPWRWNLLLKCQHQDEDYCPADRDCVACDFWKRVHGFKTVLTDVGDTSCSSSPSIDYENDEVDNSDLSSCSSNKALSCDLSDTGECDYTSSSTNITEEVLCEENRLLASDFYGLRKSAARIKHVCRIEEVATRLPRARFASRNKLDNDTNGSIILSALPSTEKDELVEEYAALQEDETPCWPPLFFGYITSPVLIKANRKEETPAKLVMVDRKDGIAKFSSHRGAKASITERKSVQRLKRCGVCDGCLQSDCDQCMFCLDKRRNGGPGVQKRACIKRQCKLLVEGRLRRGKGKSGGKQSNA